jgi:hypothetical protein
MQSIEKDKKLSQLFHLKTAIECPNQAFWTEFDSQLQQKLRTNPISNPIKISFWEFCCRMLRQYRIPSFACAVSCLAMIGTISYHSVQHTRQLRIRHELFAANNAPSFQKNYADTTLALNSGTNYFRNLDQQIYRSELNSYSKELAF